MIGSGSQGLLEIENLSVGCWIQFSLSRLLLAQR